MCVGVFEINTFIKFMQVKKYCVRSFIKQIFSLIKFDRQVPSFVQFCKIPQEGERIRSMK